jgi:hypothetical protein
MSGIERAFQEGGWGMWPTLVLGTLALALALRHALFPKSSLMPLIIGVGTASLFSGFLGVTMGFISTLRYVAKVPANEQIPIVFVGVSESLFNVILAFVLAVLIALATGVGSWRVSKGAQRLGSGQLG